MTAPVCIVTGSNSGLGLVVATKMAHLGYEVVMACRNETSANKAMAEVREKVTGAKLTFMKLDLGSIKAIESFVKTFLDSGKDLKILINNAGVMKTDKSPTFTTDGFESQFGVNHLGTFYLTMLLLEKLKSCAPSRVVTVASSLHDPSFNKTGRKVPHLDFDNLQLIEPNTFNAMVAYSNSKLGSILFTKELSRRLGANSGVTVNTLCPGWIPVTGLNGGSCQSCFLTCCFQYLCKCCKVTRTVDEGTDCMVFVATDKTIEGITGKHFMDCKEKASSPESNDPAVAEKLWNVSLELLKLPEDSPVRSV